MNDRHKRKFANLLRMCELMKKQDADVLVVDHPEVLGGTFEEIVTNLNHLAEEELMIQIVPAKGRARRP